MTQKKGFVLWLTGLSGAGKSTIAENLSDQLRVGGRRIEILDGDEVRTNLSKGLGFSKEDRDTNVKRIGFVAKLLARNGVGVITAAISPYREVRREVREAVEKNGAEFLEVFVKCPLETLVERDIKGLYKQALAGDIANFTGVSDPYEEPLAPDLTLETDLETVAESSTKITDELLKRGLLTKEHQVF
jgi:adenylyl-sulfate kinase